MDVRKRLAAAWGAFASPPQASGDITSSRDLSLLMRQGSGTSAGIHVNEDVAMTISAIYRSVDLISGAVANMPASVREDRGDGGVVALEDHPLSLVLRRKGYRGIPSPRLIKTATAHVLLTGNGYFRPIRVGGEIVALQPLHPLRVGIEERGGEVIRYTYTNAAGGVVNLRPDQIVHLMNLTLDSVRGVTPITYAREGIGLSRATQLHGSSFFRNGTNIGGILSAPNKVSPEGREQMKASMEAFQGPDSAHKSLVLSEGMTYTPAGINMADAQFVEGMKFSRTDIAMFFGVPPHMLGDAEASDGSGRNLEERSRSFINYTLADYLTMWESALTCAAFPDDPRRWVEFDRESLIKADTGARSKSEAASIQWGILNPDEVRRKRGLPPRADGKGGEYAPPPNTTNKGKAEDNTDDRTQPSDD